MITTGWLNLTEYSSKYKVSISTLRRRIKAGELECRLEDGKYLLKDSPSPIGSGPAMTTNAPPQDLVPSRRPTTAIPAAPFSAATSILREELPGASEESSSPLAITANKLLNELKKAYSLILQEKEEQILQLREEVADLRTLVKVLEEELNRAKAKPNSAFVSLANDDWLDQLEK